MFVNLVTMFARNPFVQTRTRTLIIVAITTIALLAACGGDDDGGSTPNNVRTPITADLLPTVISSDLAVGENRFSLGLLDQTAEGDPVVTGADLHLRFFLVDEAGEGTLEFEADPEPIVIDRFSTHLHDDGTVHVHEAGETGAYVAYVDFDTAGDWGVEVTGATPGGEDLEPVRLSFNVLEEHFGLAVGDPAPPTVQTILSDVIDIAEIDTSEVPIPEQHDMTIADAVASGRPTVVAIVTPAFCQTVICGPIKELFDDLYEEHRDEANFIHVEPYDVECARSGEFQTLFDCANPIVEEWGLRSEPWVYIIDSDGVIAAAFDGIASLEEMQAALDEVLA
ncbi:MAG TPA: hypothetical protein VMR52_11235 [Dehalococcoidia bacterium]|nr:hypothetical protein [Dehalococcoidia bacterium]